MCFTNVLFTGMALCIDINAACLLLAYNSQHEHTSLPGCCCELRMHYQTGMHVLL